MPKKFKTFYERIGKHNGTEFKMPSLANQDSEKECNINCMIEKYGLKSLLLKNKPEEQYYVDMTLYEGKSLNDIIELKEDMENYFYKMPAKVRKEFNDDFDKFYEGFRKGDFDKFINNGILTDETIKEIKAYEKAEKDKYIADLTEQYKIQEKARLEAKKELEQNEG